MHSAKQDKQECARSLTIPSPHKIRAAEDRRTTRLFRVTRSLTYSQDRPDQSQSPAPLERGAETLQDIVPPPTWSESTMAQAAAAGVQPPGPIEDYFAKVEQRYDQVTGQIGQIAAVLDSLAAEVKELKGLGKAKPQTAAQPMAVDEPQGAPEPKPRRKKRPGIQNEGEVSSARFPIYKNDGTEDFATWCYTFNRLCEINDLTDEECRDYLTTCMRGKAARATRHWHPDDFSDIETMLKAYRDKFETPAQKALAETEYYSARQKKDEPLGEWHDRLRELYERVFGSGTAEDSATNRDLRRRFLQGIREEFIRTHAQLHVAFAGKQGYDYEYALESAQNAQSVALEKAYKLSSSRAGGGTSSENTGNRRNGSRPPEEPMDVSSLAALGFTKDQMKRCKGCDALGHMVGSCPNPVLSKAKQKKNPAGGKGKKGGAKAKGGKAAAPALKGPQPAPRVSHIETPALEYHPDHPEAEDAPEPVVTQPDF